MNSPRFRLLGQAVLFLILGLYGVSGFAQNANNYNVQSSAGNSNSPLQPPPGSDLWNLQQRQAALGNLQQEIDAYKATKDWMQMQDQIANDKWVRAYENASDLLSAGDKAYGTDHVNGLRPDKHTDDQPRWEDESSDAGHLRTLQHAIGYDARKLGLRIVPGTGTEKELLDQLSRQVSVELMKVQRSLGNAGLLNNQSYDVVAPSSTGTPAPTDSETGWPDSPTRGPGSAGLSFGDMSTHTSPDGLKTVPKLSMCLELSCPTRFFNKTWTVSKGEQVIATGLGDVKLLDGGLFAANAPGGGPYKLYSASTGKPISGSQFIEAQAVGGGFVATRATTWDTQWQVKDAFGKVVGTFNGGGQASYAGDGTIKVVSNYGNVQYINVSGNSLAQNPSSGPASANLSAASAITVIRNNSSPSPLWELRDSRGNKIGDGSYAQIKALDAGMIAVSKDPPGFLHSGWDVFSSDGIRIVAGVAQVRSVGPGMIAVSKDSPGFSNSGWQTISVPTVKSTLASPAASTQPAPPPAAQPNKLTALPTHPAAQVMILPQNNSLAKPTTLAAPATHPASPTITPAKPKTSSLTKVSGRNDRLRKHAAQAQSTAHGKRRVQTSRVQDRAARSNAAAHAASVEANSRKNARINVPKRSRSAAALHPYTASSAYPHKKLNSAARAKVTSTAHQAPPQMGPRAHSESVSRTMQPSRAFPVVTVQNQQHQISGVARTSYPILPQRQTVRVPQRLKVVQPRPLGQIYTIKVPAMNYPVQTYAPIQVQSYQPIRTYTLESTPIKTQLSPAPAYQTFQVQSPIGQTPQPAQLNPSNHQNLSWPQSVQTNPVPQHQQLPQNQSSQVSVPIQQPKPLAATGSAPPRSVTPPPTSHPPIVIRPR